MQDILKVISRNNEITASQINIPHKYQKVCLLLIKKYNEN